MESPGLDWPLLAGLLASMVHVWAGPDHLAAVVPLVFERTRRHWKVGASWGLGHVTGMLLIGALFYYFKDLIPVESISEYSELLVGFILIGIGVRALYRANQRQKHHEHPHIHAEGEDSYIHIHPHNHGQEQHKHRRRHKQDAVAAAGIGVIHGLAGVSHFLIMLPVLGFSSDADSAMYLVGFGTGTILAMAFFAGLLGRISKLPSHEHRPRFLKGLQWTGGLLAIGIGVWWLTI